MNQDIKAEMTVSATAQRGAALSVSKSLQTLYSVAAHDPQGRLKWTDEFHNIVVTAGLNDSLDKHFKGSNYTAAWYVGLLSATPTVDPTDTMASHDGWTEVAAYDEAVRQTLTLGSISGGSVSNTAAKAVFTISTDSTDIGGAFISNGSAKATDSGYNTGVLYGAGAFTQGNKSLDDGDTLTVTVTLTATAA
jgi:hypothetical protein